MKYLITCGLSFIIMLSNVSLAHAQGSETKPPFSPKIVVKYSLYSLLEIEPVVQLGVEYIFKPKIGFQQQFGYVFNNPTFFDEGRWGIRSRSEMRFYYTKGDRAQGYVAPEVLYKFVQQYGRRIFWRENGAYQQTIDVRANRNVIGFMPKVGITNNVFENKFAVDFAVGIGVKAVYYNSNVPGDAFTDRNFIDDAFFNNSLRNSGFEVMPNLYFGLLLGFVAN